MYRDRGGGGGPLDRKRIINVALDKQLEKSSAAPTSRALKEKAVPSTSAGKWHHRNINQHMDTLSSSTLTTKNKCSDGM